MKWTTTFLAIAALASSFTSSAQMPLPQQVPEPPQPPGAIPLPVANAATAPLPESWAAYGSWAFLRNVSRPTLTPILPAPGRATGAAMIVAPGGAYMVLSMKSEGFDIARQLAERGIAAFVLKYRLDPTSADLNAFNGQFVGAMAAAAQGKEGPEALKPHEPAVADAQAAMRLVRARAAEWGVDPRRVGFLGFSAGAMTALGLVAADVKGTMPDFVAPIYPPMQTMVVPPDAPPMFTAIADDDQLFGRRGFALIEAWQHAKKPVEFHLYERGGHGFVGKQRITTEHWLDEFYWWLEMRGLFKPA